MAIEIEQPTNEATKIEKMDGITILLRSSRNSLSIKDFAQILGRAFDDLELSFLIDEIKKIGIIE